MRCDFVYSKGEKGDTVGLTPSPQLGSGSCPLAVVLKVTKEPAGLRKQHIFYRHWLFVAGVILSF